MHRRIQLFMSAAAVLAATAGCGGVGNKADDPQYVTVCSDKAITGSHVSRLRCHRQRDAAEREREDRHRMEKLQYDSVRPQGPTGPTP
jgi:hypothetical protein